jgi:hypothetical protein
MRCRSVLAVSLVPGLLYFMRINPSINVTLSTREDVMIRSPAAELVIIAGQANLIRRKVVQLQKNFNNIAPRCEWFITGKQCCNEHHHHKGRKCDLITCPITEIKEDPSK